MVLAVILFAKKLEWVEISTKTSGVGSNHVPCHEPGRNILKNANKEQNKWKTMRLE